MAKAGKIKYRTGDVIAIPLPDGLFAYARIFEYGDLGVYQYSARDMQSVQEARGQPISFFVVSTDSAIKDGSWPIVGFEPFQADEDPYAPAVATCYDYDTHTWTMGRPRISHKGVDKFVSDKQVKDLDRLLVCHKPELAVEIIVDRLINGNHAPYKVRES
jgi:hypothetical protein